MTRLIAALSLLALAACSTRSGDSGTLVHAKLPWYCAAHEDAGGVASCQVSLEDCEYRLESGSYDRCFASSSAECFTMKGDDGTLFDFCAPTRSQCNRLRTADGTEGEDVLVKRTACKNTPVEDVLTRRAYRIGVKAGAREEHWRAGHPATNQWHCTVNLDLPQINTCMKTAELCEEFRRLAPERGECFTHPIAVCFTYESTERGIAINNCSASQSACDFARQHQAKSPGEWSSMGKCEARRNPAP